MTKTEHRYPYESWQVRKPAVESRGGLASSQHYLASKVAADILRDGGDAVDAAVAASLAIGTQEPWMSGLGGGGMMLVYRAAENKTYCVNGGMVAAKRLNPALYPMTDAVGTDLFNWPQVQDDRNLHGYHAVAVPGLVALLDAAAAKWGKRNWPDLVAPAIDLAEKGIGVDWYATLLISTAARILNLYDHSRDIYLPGGFPPSGEWGGPIPEIQLGRLPETLQRLATDGAEGFYRGALAEDIVKDLELAGSAIRLDDFAAYEASITAADWMDYHGARVETAPGLTAGPSLQHALGLLAQHVGDKDRQGKAPDAEMYHGYADALQEAYRHRLETMGDSDGAATPSCTTHMTIVDRNGNIVALTQTLLSLFGSKVMLPQTGILMNNGIMWFDPRPGRPNAIAAGRRPLSNMCPTIVHRADGFRFGLGASGGRRIMPAVFQLISFMADHGMTLEEAAHTPRLDVSGTETVTLDTRLEEKIQARLNEKFQTRTAINGVYPAMYACPNAAGMAANGNQSGVAYITSPWAQTIAAD